MRNNNQLPHYAARSLSDSIGRTPAHPAGMASCHRRFQLAGRLHAAECGRPVCRGLPAPPLEPADSAGHLARLGRHYRSPSRSAVFRRIDGFALSRAGTDWVGWHRVARNGGWRAPARVGIRCAGNHRRFHSLLRAEHLLYLAGFALLSAHCGRSPPGVDYRAAGVPAVVLFLPKRACQRCALLYRVRRLHAGLRRSAGIPSGHGRQGRRTGAAAAAVV